MNESIFYHSQPILSYKRLYNLICHLRGKGKTYHFTKKAIELGIKYKKVSTIILVRYKEDLKGLTDGWWDIVAHLFPDYSFQTTKRVVYANNGLEKFPIAEFIPLREYIRAKRTPRPYVKMIWFDEFLNEENDYLENEMKAFMSICDSVIRNRDDCKVILTSNTITMLNPYFEYFGITKLEGQFTKGLHDSIVEFVAKDDEFIEFRKNTTFGSTIDGTEYGGFALEGKFLLDDTTNVLPNPKGTYHYLFDLVLHGVFISVYNVNCLMYFAVSKDRCKKSFTPYLDDAKNNGAIYQKKDFRIYDSIMGRVLRDEVMYENLKIKNEVLDIVKWKMNVTSQNR